MRVFHNPNAFERHIRSCGWKIKDKQLIVSRTEDIIDPYLTGDPNVKYLTCTDQMDKFKPIKYNIVYDFETMEELIDNKKEDITIELEDHSSSSSSSPSSSSSSSSRLVTLFYSLLHGLQRLKVELRLDILIIEMFETLLLNGWNL
jgi:hypothetical protein